MDGQAQNGDESGDFPGDAHDVGDHESRTGDAVERGHHDEGLDFVPAVIAGHEA